MSLEKVRTSADPDHLTACPFVLPGTPVPHQGVGNNGQEPVAFRRLRQTGSMNAGEITTPVQNGASVIASPAARPGAAGNGGRVHSQRLQACTGARCCRPYGMCRSTCTVEQSSAWSAKAGRVRLRWPNYSPVRSGSRRERSVLNGQPVALSDQRAFRKYKSEVQLVFQDPFSSLNPVHTVRYHLERPVKLHQHKRSKAELDAELTRLMEQVHLTPAGQFLAKYPHELSGGQRQTSVFRSRTGGPAERAVG